MRRLVHLVLFCLVVSCRAAFGLDAEPQAGAAAASTRRGFVSIHDFGAIGDGKADDTAAVQRFFDALRRGGAGTCPSGTFRLTAPIRADAEKPYGVWFGGKRVCVFLIDFEGWDKVALDLGGPAPAQERRSAEITFNGGFTIAYARGLRAPPVALQQRFSRGLMINGGVQIIQYSARRGTVLRLTAVYNARLDGVEIWGGGGFRAWRIAAPSTRFSIRRGEKTIVSSQPEFTPTDAGRILALRGAPLTEAFRLTAYEGPTRMATTRAAAFEHVEETAAFDGLRGAISKGSSVLRLEAARLGPEDVGRVIYIPGAGVGGVGVQPLRARIDAVHGAEATLSTPALNDVADAELILSPVAEIIDDEDVGSNDVQMHGLHIEHGAGVQLLARRCLNCTFDRTKLHGLNTPPAHFGRSDFETQRQAALFGVDGRLDGDIEGLSVSDAQILLEGARNTGFAFGHTMGIIVTGQAFLSMRRNGRSTTVTMGPRASNAPFDPNWAAALIHNDGSSTNGVVSQGPVTGYNTPAYAPSAAMPVERLPPCGPSRGGARAMALDLAGQSYTLGAAASGGGARKGPVFCDGARWREG